MDGSNDGAALLGNLLDIPHQGVGHFGVQSAGRLVQQKEARIPAGQIREI